MYCVYVNSCTVYFASISERSPLYNQREFPTPAIECDDENNENEQVSKAELAISRLLTSTRRLHRSKLPSRTGEMSGDTSRDNHGLEDPSPMQLVRCTVATCRTQCETDVYLVGCIEISSVFVERNVASVVVQLDNGRTWSVSTPAACAVQVVVLLFTPLSLQCTPLQMCGRFLSPPPRACHGRCTSCKLACFL